MFHLIGINFFQRYKMFNIIECPREAFQNHQQFIETEDKIHYINQLLRIGFDVLDVGSVVSPAKIPQMKDIWKVIDGISTTDQTKISVLTPLSSSAKKAIQKDKIDIISFPYSVSETFLLKNINKTKNEAFLELSEISSIIEESNKKISVYISMCFGNPYQEEFSIDLVKREIEKLAKLPNIIRIHLSDTCDFVREESLEKFYNEIVKCYKNIDFSLHFHSNVDKSEKLLNFAYQVGYRTFESCMKGLGGCPTEKTLGNLPTSQLINFIQKNKIDKKINSLEYESCYNTCLKLFNLNFITN
jgi:hydroxymethylglutaryl-CoA lyase